MTFHNLVKISSKSLLLKFWAGPFAITTKSNGLSLSWAFLKFSRTIRLTRFRHTAFLRAFFGTIKPKRGKPKPFSFASTVMDGDPALIGSLKTELKLSGVSSLDSLEKFLLAINSCQANAALSTTAGKYLASVCSLHAAAEPVNTLALQYVRLKSALHYSYLPKITKN